jgi:hypothetical protein
MDDFTWVPRISGRPRTPHHIWVDYDGEHHTGMGNGTHNLLIGGHKSLPPSQGPWCQVFQHLWVLFEHARLQWKCTNSSHALFYLKIGYDITQTCAHICKTSHYIDIENICCKSQRETIYKYSILFKLPTKSLVIGPVAPTIQHNVNSLWHAFMKRHAILCTEIGVHVTHTLPQFLDTS